MPALPSRCLRRNAPKFAVLPPGVAWLVLIVVPQAVSAADPDGIAWRSNFESARAEAKSKNLPLWVQFTGPWCGYCRLMDRETFARPEVAAAARDRFIAVKVQADDREDLVAAFGVTGLPCSVILSTRGEVAARREGFVGPSEFLGVLASVPRPSRFSSENDGVALAGYCPVSLMQGRGLAPGQREWSVTHQGREYRFAREADRDEFLRDPSVFLPRSGGRCVVSLVERGEGIAGRPEFGASYKGRLYLFADEASRKRFARDPERYAIADEPAERGILARLIRKLPESIRTSEGSTREVAESIKR